ncbi:MAG: hypothetical protein WDN48_13380 [Pseudolabrys sp.]
MFVRFAALTLALVFFAAPAQAQDQAFAVFVTELWPDAQAKGITRATFDLAMNGVTPDQRVIGGDQAPARIRQAGRHLHQRYRFAEPHQSRHGQSQGMAENLRRRGKEIRR